MRLPALAVVLTALTFSPSYACQTPAQVQAAVVAQHPDTTVHLRFSGADAVRFIEKYNALPPATDFVGDEVMILKDPNFPRVYLIQLFKDGCLTGGGSMPRYMVEALRAAVTKVSGQRV